jgi:hypothetical protein
MIWAQILPSRSNELACMNRFLNGHDGLAQASQTFKPRFASTNPLVKTALDRLHNPDGMHHPDQPKSPTLENQLCALKYPKSPAT